jgi:hypothetical protein
VVTRIVTFAGTSVAVRSDSPACTRLVGFLLLDAPEERRTPPRVTLTVRRDTEAGGFRLEREGARIYQDGSLEGLAAVLLGEVIHDLVEPCRDGMALHAAALSRDGTGLLLPGRSGSGKSSLAAWLTRRGLNYLTDELVFVPEGTERLEYFTRPIGMKETGLSALRELLDVDRHGDAVVAGGLATMVPHRLLNPSHVPETPTLRVIVFPRYCAGAEPVLEPLSRAEGGLGVMECLVNARNLDGHGLSEVSRLVRSVPAYRLTYSRFDQLPGVLGAFLP